MLFKPKYRIIEEKTGLGNSKFYPQKRKWFLWHYFPESNALTMQNALTRHDSTWFASKETAEEYLITIYKTYMRDKIVKTKKHEFDAVFQALKNE